MISRHGGSSSWMYQQHMLSCMSTHAGVAQLLLQRLLHWVPCIENNEGLTGRVGTLQK